MNTFFPKTVSGLKLEKEFAEPFNAWKKTPNPTTTSAILTKLNPAIDKGLHAHAGGVKDPIMRSHARWLTLTALKTYDPVQSALTTHVVNHLQGLKRIRGRRGHVLKTPERVMLDRARLDEAENVFEDTHGREPSLTELADETGLSMKRISHVRKFRTPLSQGFLESQSEGGANAFPAVREQKSDTWLEVVYGDLNNINKKILEWTLGLHGNPILSNQKIAAKLRLSPGAISQRKQSIQNLLDQEQTLSPF